MGLHGHIDVPLLRLDPGLQFLNRRRYYGQADPDATSQESKALSYQYRGQAKT